MRFKEQFEFHKVPEWDDHYFKYDSYIKVLEIIAKKMKKFKLKRMMTDEFNLSDTFQVDLNEEGKEMKDMKDGSSNLSRSIFKDDSLNFSFGTSSENEDDLEIPLLNLNTDIRELLENFVIECKDINDFYVSEKQRILDGYDHFYSRFLNKISDHRVQMNLEGDLKGHNLDALGYSSSWSRQFVEFYSKLSWLEGYSKINIIAMQKILLKFDNVLFSVTESHFHKKLNTFINDLPLHQDQDWIEERREIIKSVAKHYFRDRKREAFTFLESCLSAHKSEHYGTLYFLLGAVVALACVLFFLFMTPKKLDYIDLYTVKEIYPIFRWTLLFIISLFFCGVVIKYLKEYRVNYVIIFESNPVNRLAPNGVYILSAILMIIWLFWMIGEVSVLKDFLAYKPDLFAIILVWFIGTF